MTSQCIVYFFLCVVVDPGSYVKSFCVVTSALAISSCPSFLHPWFFVLDKISQSAVQGPAVCVLIDCKCKGKELDKVKASNVWFTAPFFFFFKLICLYTVWTSHLCLLSAPSPTSSQSLETVLSSLQTFINPFSLSFSVSGHICVWRIPPLRVQWGEPAVLLGLWAVQKFVHHLQPEPTRQGDRCHLHSAWLTSWGRSAW